MDSSNTQQGSSAPVSTPLTQAVFIKANKLVPDSTGVNLIGKVVTVYELPDRKTKKITDGDRVGEAVIGDETGIVTISLRKNQYPLFAVGRTLIVRNGLVKMKAQHMRLEVNKWGKISIADEPAKFQVNQKHDLSAVEYELVSVPE